MASINPECFFKEKRNTSEIKSEILNKYFKAWCGILLYGQKFKRINTVLYVDLYSGPGYYEDGQPSTPIKILESIHKSSGERIDLNMSVKTFFNDSTKSVVEKLKANLSSLPFYEELHHAPLVLNEKANQRLLVNLLNNSNPSLTFIDPFGYSFSQEMLLQSVKNWGSDLFMLFNVNRIRSAVLNDNVSDLMKEIFGDRINDIREYYKREKKPKKRETFIIDSFENIFRERNYLTFKFKINFPHRNQTSHYLVFVTKARIAYMRIKEIMTKYSDFQEDGVPLFGANQKRLRLLVPDYHRYLPHSIINLTEDLYRKQSLYNLCSINEVFENHNIGTNYIKENYKEAFRLLRERGLVDIRDAKKGGPAGKITYTSIIQFD